MHNQLIIATQLLTCSLSTFLTPNGHPPAPIKRLLVHAVPPHIRQVHIQPLQPMRPQRARLCKPQQAAAPVVAQMLQARVQRVRAPSEVERVRVVELGGVPELARHAEFEQEVGAEGGEVALALARVVAGQGVVAALVLWEAGVERCQVMSGTRSVK